MKERKGRRKNEKERVKKRKKQSDKEIWKESRHIEEVKFLFLINVI